MMQIEYKQIIDNYERLIPLVTDFETYYASIGNRTSRGESFGIEFTKATVERVKKESGVIIGAFEGAILKGFCVGVIEHMSDYHITAEGNEYIYGIITDLFISPDVEKKGIGTALLQHTESCLKEKGATKFSLEVIELNKKVIDFYTKNGYHIDSYILSK